MGLRFDSVTEADLIGVVLDELDRGHGGWVITSNLEHLRQFVGEPQLRSLFSKADLVVADGMPLVWASKVQGTPLPGRVAGSELVWSLSAEAGLVGRSIFLLGDRADARERAEAKLRRHYPGLRIAGSYSPPMGFELDPHAVEQIRERLVAAAPDIVYVALGFPKQERLIEAIREDLPSTWFMGIGISLSFLGGSVARAPTWMRELGLEWLHRLGQEPRRLARRYLLDGLPFAVRLLAHAARARVRGAPPPTEPARELSSRRVVFTAGALERERAKALVGVDDALDGPRIGSRTGGGKGSP